MAELQDILSASYQSNRDAENTLQNHGYKLDREYSDRNAKVFVNPQGESNIVFRGSKAPVDFFRSDLLLGLGLNKLDPRQQESNNLIEKVQKKYNKDPNLYGHSLGGSLAEKAAKATGNTGKIITYNKGASPFDIFQRNPNNQTDVRTSGDLVSSLSRMQSGGKKQEIKFNKGVLKSHNLKQLRRIN